MGTQRLQQPRQFVRSGDLAAFVVAARTPHLAAACDLLFVSPLDLIWEEKGFGLFVVDAPFEDGAAEQLLLAEGFGDFEFKRQLNAQWPQFREILVHVLAAVVKESKAGPPTERLASLIGAALHESNDKGQGWVEKLLPSIANIVPLVVSWGGARLALAALAHRKRQVSVTGLSPARYAAMVKALRELRLVHPMIRIARPPSSPFPELSLSSANGLAASVPGVGAQTIEVLRLSPAITTNRLGTDRALSMFIAEFINNEVFGSQAAYASARYGELCDPEFDVVVPEARVGFEVKLVQASSAKTLENLTKQGQELKKQLPNYFDAGCDEVYFVTNVEMSLAREMMKIVRTEPRLAEKKIKVIAGDMQQLKDELQAIAERLKEARGESLMKEIEALAALKSPSSSAQAPDTSTTRDPAPGSGDAIGSGAAAAETPAPPAAAAAETSADAN